MWLPYCCETLWCYTVPQFPYSYSRNSRSHRVACFWRELPGQRADNAEWTGGRLEHTRTVEFPVLEAGRKGFGRLERTLKRSLNHQTGIEQYALPCAWCLPLPWDFPWCYTALTIRITPTNLISLQFSHDHSTFHVLNHICMSPYRTCHLLPIP